MKTKIWLSCVGAVTLAYSVAHFSARQRSSAPFRGEASAHGIVNIGRASWATTMADAANVPRQDAVGISHVPKPNVKSFMAEWRELPGPGEPEQRRSQVEQLVVAQNVAVLRDLLADAQSVLALPEDVYQAMLRRLAQADAPWTADYLQALPAGALRSELLGTALAQWGADDLLAAIGWAQKLADTLLQQTALVHLSYRWFEADPAGALAFATGLPADHSRLMTTLVAQWSRREPAAAAAWAAQFGNEGANATLAAGAVASWAENDELAAAEFVLKLPTGRTQHEAAISVMSALAQKDPVTGTQWVAAFPAGRERDYAIEILGFRWATPDPGSALSWINQLPARERDLAIHAGAGGLIETRPELAAAWAIAIQDESRRVQQTERAARRWLEIDRSAAETWIRQSLLPAQAKIRLLAVAQSGP